MKIKKALSLVLVVAGLVGGVAVIGHAASGWYVCQVEMAGFYSRAGVSVFLTDTAAPPEFENQEFQVPPARGREFLAVALEAISQGRKVKVYVNPGGRSGSWITAIYLQAQ